MAPLMFVLFALTVALVVAAISDESDDDDDYIIYDIAKESIYYDMGLGGDLNEDN